LQEKANAKEVNAMTAEGPIPDGPLEQGGFFGTSRTADFTKQVKRIIDA
jgi:hypothetical protein